MRWTPESRARQSALIRTWRPWLASTGPVTPEGRARSARNADKGLGTAELREMSRMVNGLIRQSREAIDAI